MIFIKFFIIYILACTFLSFLYALPEIITFKQKNKKITGSQFCFFEKAEDNILQTQNNFIQNIDYPTSSIVKAPFFLSKDKKKELLKQIPDDNDDVEFREDLVAIQEEIISRELFDNDMSSYRKEYQ